MTVLSDVLFDDNPVPLLVLDRSGSIIRSNRLLRDLVGFTPEQRRTRLDEFSTLLHRNDETDPRQEYRLITTDGGHKMLAEISFRESSAHEEPVLIASVREPFPLSDISFERSNPLFKALFDKALDMILVADDSGRLVQVNDTACRMLGYSAKELTSMRVADISAWPEKSETAEVWHRFLETGFDSGEYFLRTREGEVIQAHYRAVANVQPGQHLSILRDVSGPRKCRNRLKNFLLTGLSSVLIVNSRGEIEFANEQVREMFGYNPDALLGQPVETLIPERFRTSHRRHRKNYMETPVRRPMGTGIELRARRQDGSEFPVDVSLGPLQEDGETKALTVIRDISHHKEVQLKLENEKEFIGLLHDLSMADNRAHDFHDLLKVCVEKITRYMEWDIGHAYLPARDRSGEFVPSGLWYTSDTGKYDRFRNLTLQTRFRPGEGMIGKVAQTGRPMWIKNTQADPEFVRRYEDSDLKVRACIGIPILIESTVAGILEFYSSRELPHDDLLLQKISTIGIQVGRVFERMQSNARLQESEEKFRTFFNSIHDAILLTDGKRWVDCNRKGRELFGKCCDFVAGAEIESLFPDQADQLRAMVKRALGGDHVQKEWILRPDSESSPLYFEVDAFPVELNDSRLVEFIFRDISERKESDRQMRYHAALFNQLFENTPAGVILLETDGRIKRANRSFESIFGYTRSEVIRRHVNELIVPDKDIGEADGFRDRCIRGEAFQEETVRLRKDGSRVPVLIAAVPVTIDGSVIGLIGMYVDITERIESEKKIAQSLREKEMLLAEIHHRVKNNLALISGLLELQGETVGDPEVRSVFRDSQNRIKSMALVHEQLYQVEVFSAIRFDRYIHSLASTLISSNRPESTDIDLRIEADPVNLEMSEAIPCGLLLSELITNACKHAFRELENGVITIRLQRNFDEVELSVKDDGVGLPEQSVVDKPGSLGMRLVKTLTEQLEGKLDIESGKGTLFTVRFRPS